MMQRQWGMLGVSGVSWPQSGHHWLHGDVGKTKCSSCKDISNAWIHLRVVALVRRHQMGRGILTQDPRQVVLPCYDL